MEELPMPIHETLQTRGVPVHVFTDEIDPKARQQLIDLAESGIVTGFVAAMPDVHYGMGATVGSVFASDFAVCPNAVGVDIGCGMAALPVPGLTRNGCTLDRLETIHAEIKRRVPTGMEVHPRAQHAPVLDDADRTPWLSRQISSRVTRSLGTLGGGNHFIEVLHDEDGGVWIMLHSGSRNIGKLTAEHYNTLAKTQMTARGVKAPNADLNHLLIDSDEGRAYLTDMTWCQKYAAANRHAMLEAVAAVVAEATGRAPDWSQAVNIHHNYCSHETFTYDDPKAGTPVTRALWVTRKGATSAREGQLGVIPGSMGTGSFVVRGLGNPLSWHSCSHGAGRQRSRTASLAQIRQEDFEQAMAGIVCETVPELRDEAPQAYKDITSVMSHQRDLVAPVRRLLPLVNVKGYEKKSGRQAGARGLVWLKAPVRFTKDAAFDFTITGVEVAKMDAKGKGLSETVAAEAFVLRVKPNMVGETRELWVRTAEAPQRRLLVCTVAEATETGITLTIQAVKRVVKTSAPEA
jgi:tRNA-splicing ligase RtcB (3'-phosphate/5'-hydroxy nucleic acid ligase)